ncbi:LacI family transcriptional regulator [Marinobacterium nitratireducens]|uniref:LacI family transcriptional regulator n=1 Tax=Marinobacterium nitratireducens TaxID=518897 RepID=A0A918DVQ4_9GAMM|nr:LacI family DNA-binding transcriptional regulator [Marinobacterium nitratireducens]GGO85547.1 LacI family transcriptional regulator [Marinobacterium nitratireducens]
MPSRPSRKMAAASDAQVPSKSATIHEIAEAAGVSIASVSRALNGKPGISEKLRAHILEISERIQYQPSAAARQLISGKNAVVGISMERHSFELRPYYNLLYRNLTLELHKRGMVPVTISYEDTSNLYLQAGSAILLGREPGDYRPQRLSEQGIPYIRIDQPDPGFSIGTDGVDGVYQATRHLIAQGRQHFAYAGEELSHPLEPIFRVNGFRRALKEAGLATVCEIPVPFSYNPTLNAYRHMRRMLQTDGLQFDALICETDEHALGCIAAFEDAGIKVPDQVAVTGFDDLPLLAAHLTTVRQDIPQLAAEAVKLLGEAIAGAPPRQVLMPVELILRDTA